MKLNAAQRRRFAPPEPLVAMDLRLAALPSMRALAQATGETVLLVVRGCNECTVAEGVEAPNSVIRYRARIGARLPAHAGTGSKLLLAFQPDKAVERYLRGLSAASGEHPVIDPAHLRTELAKIRIYGWAVSRENATGISAVSAPIRDFAGSVIAALSLVGPSFRLPPNRVRTLIANVVDTASSISGSLLH
jgi:DNA-binding IclR family transcriptional regulator